MHCFALAACESVLTCVWFLLGELEFRLFDSKNSLELLSPWLETVRTPMQVIPCGL